MASATRKTVEKVVKEVKGVTLELSAEEAEWLKGYLFGAGNGHPYNIYRALNAPTEAPEDRPIEVGEKVRVTKSSGCDSYLTGKTGTLKRVDEHDDNLPFLVDVVGEHWAWVESVERVND